MRGEPRILLVEDDRELGTQIVAHLRGAGFHTLWWTEGRRIATDAAPEVDLVILDLMLPGVHGMEMLKELRASSEVPLVILSARTDTLDKVRALRLGADDYVTKPFWPEELVERVRARLRRPVLERQGVLTIGELYIDLPRREVIVDGRPIELTRVELDLLAALAQRPGVAITRQSLVEHVLDPERDGNERTLDVHVSRLRKKLPRASLIETVWGIGYRLSVVAGGRDA